MMTRRTRVPWRTLAGGLPAVALIGSGLALAATDGNTSTDIVADSSPLVTVPSRPLTRLDAPALPPLPQLPAPAEAEPTAPYQPASLPQSMSANGIPAAALSAYQRAAQLVDAADPQCRLDWALVAAIGKVESDHGRYGGNGIDGDGTVRPGIYGIPLDGRNATAVIRDTDGGAYDRDPTWDRAVGPMQFIPGTWRSVGVDANADGRKDPQNLADAATATAVYLCSGPGDLSADGGARSAVLRYNRSDAYADQVLAIAAGYRGGYTVLPGSALTAAQRNGSPYLPTGDEPTMAHYDPAAAVKPAPTPTTRTPAKRPPRARAGVRTSTAQPTPAPGGPGAPATPAPTTTARGSLTDTVPGVVGGVVGGLTGSTATATASPSPGPTATASPTATTTPPLTLLPKGGVCPEGYQLNVLRTLCLRL